MDITIMNRLERKAAAHLALEGWTIVRGGAPDFLAYKTGSDGTIVKVGCFEVKSKMDVVSPTQEEQLRVLASVGIEAVVLRESLDGNFYPVRIDATVSPEALDNITKRLENDNTRKEASLKAREEAYRLEKLRIQEEQRITIEKETMLDQEVALMNETIGRLSSQWLSEAGKKVVRPWIRKYGFFVAQTAVERSFSRYYKKKEDWDKAFDNIEGMFKYQHQSNEEFEFEGQMAYAGAIVKNRLKLKGWNTEPEWVGWKMIQSAWKKSNKSARDLVNLVLSYSVEDLREFVIS